MNQKWYTKDGSKWKLMKLSEQDKSKIEETSKREHNELMLNCIFRAKKI